MKRAKSRVRQPGLVFTLLVVLMAGGLSGCTTERTSTQQRAPIDDRAEMRAIVADSRDSIKPIIRTLVRLDKLNGPCPVEVHTRLTTDINRLQMESLKFRSHAQAMQSRGDAYFAEWQQHLPAASDPKGCKSAMKRRPLLEQSFVQIQRASQEAAQAVNAFLSEVRTLRRTLENDRDADISESTRQLARSAINGSRHLQQDLENVLRALDAMTAKSDETLKEAIPD